MIHQSSLEVNNSNSNKNSSSRNSSRNSNSIRNKEDTTTINTPPPHPTTSVINNKNNRKNNVFLKSWWFFMMSIFLKTGKIFLNLFVGCFICKKKKNSRKKVVKQHAAKWKEEYTEQCSFGHKTDTGWFRLVILRTFICSMVEGLICAWKTTITTVTFTKLILKHFLVQQFVFRSRIV